MEIRFSPLSPNIFMWFLFHFTILSVILSNTSKKKNLNIACIGQTIYKSIERKEYIYTWWKFDHIITGTSHICSTTCVHYEHAGASTNKLVHTIPEWFVKKWSNQHKLCCLETPQLINNWSLPKPWWQN